MDFILKLLVSTYLIIVTAAVTIKNSKLDSLASIGQGKVAVVEQEFDHHPQYIFSYGIEDSKTGDSKTHEEIRDGDVVKGSYSFIDPTGKKITVKYTADKKSGFNAIILKEPVRNYKKIGSKVRSYV